MRSGSLVAHRRHALRQISTRRDRHRSARRRMQQHKLRQLTRTQRHGRRTRGAAPHTRLVDARGHDRGGRAPSRLVDPAGPFRAAGAGSYRQDGRAVASTARRGVRPASTASLVGAGYRTFLHVLGLHRARHHDRRGLRSVGDQRGLRVPLLRSRPMVGVPGGLLRGGRAGGNYHLRHAAAVERAGP